MRWIPTLLGGALIAGCGSSTLPPDPLQLMGAYTLTAVNGAPLPERDLLSVSVNGSGFLNSNLPSVVSDSSLTLSGSMIINAGSGMQMTIVSRDKLFSGIQTFSDSTRTDLRYGVWTLNGNAISFAFDGQATPAPGTVTLPKLTLTAVDSIPVSSVQTAVRIRVLTFSKQ